MVEILKSNFDEKFHDIEKAIWAADFIAVDTEFTGLYLSDRLKPTLFDGGEARYQKLRENATKFTITQFGLTTFHKEADENKYMVAAYNFYLFPPSFGPLDTYFTVQASSFAFHRHNKFDFNKYVYGGLSYLDEEKEMVARKYFIKKEIFQPTERDVDEAALQGLSSQIAEWYLNSEVGQVMVLEKDESNVNIRNNILAPQLLDRFPCIWVSSDSEGKLIVEKISHEDRSSREKDRASQQKSRDKNVIQDLLGFSRVFKVLKQCRKPLVGHNMLLDLLLIYDKFYKPLPAKYEEFKASLHELFPVIYDTKHMAAFMRKSLESDFNFTMKTALVKLYDNLKSTEGRQLVIHSPSIDLTESCSDYDDSHRPHEAGYDAYMCGYVFLRLAHIETFKYHKSTEVSPCAFRRYLADTKHFHNRINLIRGDVHHVCLDGEDPKATRPLLHVQSKRGSYRLDPVELARLFSNYGAVDIKLQNPRNALVITGHPNCAQDIQRAFRKHKDIKIGQYVTWKKYFNINRPWIIAGVCITSGVVLAAALFSRRKTSS